LNAVVNKPVEQEHNCQNYLILKVPDKKQIISIGTSAVILFSVIKLAPVILPAILTGGMGTGVIVLVETTAWLAKHILK
jgi:hypothetical protein